MFFISNLETGKGFLNRIIWIAWTSFLKKIKMIFELKSTFSFDIFLSVFL